MTGHRSNRHLEFEDAASDCRGPTSKDEEGEWKRYVCHVGWNGGPIRDGTEELTWKKERFAIFGGVRATEGRRRGSNHYFD